MVTKVQIAEIKKKLLALLRRTEVLIGLGVIVIALLGLALGSLIGSLRGQLASPTDPPATSTPTMMATEAPALPATSTPAFDLTPTPAPPDAEPEAPTPTPISPARPAGALITHVVEAGETLGGIALQYGVSVAALRAENSLASEDFIQVGQELTIPAGEVAPTATPMPQGMRIHVVAAGEVLGRIAVQYDVSVEALMEANDLTSPDQIVAGQELVIPGEAAAMLTPEIDVTPTEDAAESEPETGDEPWRPSILTGDLAAAYSETETRARYTLHYPPDSLPARELTEILAMVDTAMTQIEGPLEIHLEGDFDAYVADSLFGGDNVALRGRSFSSERRFFFLWDNTGDAADRQYIITHEATHTFTWNAIARPASVMLHEGVAVFTGMPNYEAAGYIKLEDFCAVFHQADQLPLPTGNMDFQGHIYDLTTYYSAGCFVRYLIETYGAEKFVQLYPSGDYVGIYGESLSALQEDWLATLAARTLPALLDEEGSDALIQYVTEVGQAYRRLFANFTGSPAEMRAYRALDRARTSTLAGRFTAAADHLAEFREELP